MCPDDFEPIFKLLETLSQLGFNFTVAEGDTVYIQGLDGKTIKLLDAILSARPDEHSQEEEGYRLWWD